MQRAASFYSETKERWRAGPGAQGGLWGCRCLEEIVGCNERMAREGLSG